MPADQQKQIQKIAENRRHAPRLPFCLFRDNIVEQSRNPREAVRLHAQHPTPGGQFPSRMKQQLVVRKPRHVLLKMIQKRRFEQNIVNCDSGIHIGVTHPRMDQKQISRPDGIDLLFQLMESFSVADKHQFIKIIVNMRRHLFQNMLGNECPERKILPQEM